MKETWENPICITPYVKSRLYFANTSDQADISSIPIDSVNS